MTARDTDYDEQKMKEKIRKLENIVSRMKELYVEPREFYSSWDVNIAALFKLVDE